VAIYLAFRPIAGYKPITVFIICDNVFRVAGFVDSKENKRVGSEQSWSKEGTVRHRQNKEANILCMVTPRGNKGVAWRKTRTAWMENIKKWTGLSVEESVKMTEDKDKWRKYVHSVANPRIEDG